MAHKIHSSPIQWSDSPWFWLLLFATMALAALAVIGPKHMQRQQRLVRMQEARQRVAASRPDNQPREADDSQLPQESQSPEVEQPAVSVALLWALLLALWVGAATALFMTSRRRASLATGEQPPP